MIIDKETLERLAREGIEIRKDMLIEAIRALTERVTAIESALGPNLRRPEPDDTVEVLMVGKWLRSAAGTWNIDYSPETHGVYWRWPTPEGGR